VKRALSLSGTPVSPGIAIGRAVLWLSRDDTSVKRQIEPEEIPEELERLRRAAESSVAEIEMTGRQVGERLGPEFASIFTAHALFLQDRAFLGPIEKRIENDRVNAEWAVTSTTESLVARFRDLPDEAIALRSADLEDVARTLRKHLGDEGSSPTRIEDIPGESLVIIADELTPSDAVRIPRDRVVAFATERGGKTSHAAILARSFGLPAVVAVPRLLASVADGDQVIVDGRDGVVWREPPLAVASLFLDRRRDEARREESLKALSIGSQKTLTLDGQEIAIRANIELMSEVGDVLEYGADGVGLFRSEFLYLSAGNVEFPDEAAQTAIYREVLRRLAPRPVVIRTYDLGGKKGARQLVGFDESNPVLGLRGVRLCFARPEMFRTQLRALLAAASAGDLRILVPMVSGVEEIRKVHTLLDEARDDLRRHGVPVPDHVPLGAMIEVPSAAITADVIAPEVDFMALGTNDLVQYTLAVDRANETVSELFRPHHPGVLRLLSRVASAAHAAKRPLSVCGEMAADPANFLLLLGMGIREFSMGPRTVPVIKELARGANTVEAARLTEAALTLATPDEVAAFLADAVRRHGMSESSRGVAA